MLSALREGIDGFGDVGREGERGEGLGRLSSVSGCGNADRRCYVR